MRNILFLDSWFEVVFFNFLFLYSPLIQCILTSAFPPFS